jgi:acyl-CoA thioesterase FadM
MNLYLRVLLVFIRSLFAPRIASVLDVAHLRLRVLPNDLDFNMHMNNGRYLTIMDLGRFDLILRSGLLRQMMRKKAAPVLASVQMRYRVQMNPFRQYDLETRVLCWDDKWIYMEQRFIILKGKKAGAVAAIGLVKGGFYDPATRTTVPTSELLQVMKMDTISPPFPPYLREWIAAEDSLRAATAAA